MRGPGLIFPINYGNEWAWGMIKNSVRKVNDVFSAYLKVDGYIPQELEQPDSILAHQICIHIMLCASHNSF